MLIVEGPDGAGKSTLIKELIRHWHGSPPDNYDAQVMHSPGPLDKGLYEWTMKALKNAKPVCIFDRLPYFSEAVYGRVLRGQPCMNPQEFVAIKERLLKIRPLIVYCRPPMTTLLVTREVRDQMPGVKDKYEEIVETYDQNFGFWIRDFRIFTYDFTRGAEAGRILRYALQAYITEEQRGELM